MRLQLTCLGTPFRVLESLLLGFGPAATRRLLDAANPCPQEIYTVCFSCSVYPCEAGALVKQAGTLQRSVPHYVIWQWLIRFVLSSHKMYAREKMGNSLLKSPSLFFGIGFGSVFWDQGSYGIVFDIMLVAMLVYTFIYQCVFFQIGCLFYAVSLFLSV